MSLPSQKRPKSRSRTQRSQYNFNMKKKIVDAVKVVLCFQCGEAKMSHTLCQECGAYKPMKKKNSSAVLKEVSQEAAVESTTETVKKKTATPKKKTASKSTKKAE